jgi:hypothetical protein
VKAFQAGCGLQSDVLSSKVAMRDLGGIELNLDIFNFAIDDYESSTIRMFLHICLGTGGNLTKYLIKHDSK